MEGEKEEEVEERLGQMRNKAGMRERTAEREKIRARRREVDIREKAGKIYVVGSGNDRLKEGS